MVYGYARVSTKNQDITRQIRNIKEYCPEIEDKNIYFEKFTGTKLDGREQLDKLLKVLKDGDTVIIDSVSRLSRNAEEGYNLYMKLFDSVDEKTGKHVKIDLVFLNEPHISTKVYRDSVKEFNLNCNGNEILECTEEYINKLMKIIAKQQIYLAFSQAQQEVTDLHERVKQGMLTARLNGKQIGQKEGVTLTTKKSIIAKKLIEYYCVDFNGEKKDFDVLNTLNNLTDKMIESLSKKLGIEIPRDFHISRNSYFKYKREIKESKED